jgi:hypothetical protein
MKIFYVQNNIGRAKYVVSYHDGESKHKDGSPFYGMAILKSKGALAAFVQKLYAQGYTERKGFTV